MLEMKITVEMPGISEAINNLASALGNRKASPDTIVGMAQAPVATVPDTPSIAPQPLPQSAPQSAAAVNTPSDAGSGITADDIGRAGAAMIDAGKMPQLIALLGKYGVQAITQLKPEQLGAFAEEMKALGAKF